MVVVHAGEETDRLAHNKVEHTDGTPVWERSDSSIVNQWSTIDSIIIMQRIWSTISVHTIMDLMRKALLHRSPHAINHPYNIIAIDKLLLLKDAIVIIITAVVPPLHLYPSVSLVLTPPSLHVKAVLNRHRNKVYYIITVTSLCAEFVNILMLTLLVHACDTFHGTRRLST